MKHHRRAWQVGNWHECKDACEGRDEDGCDEADHCAWSDSSNTCSFSCEHKYIDGYYCEADDSCQWVDKHDECKTACSQYTEEWSCDSDYCDFQDGSCEDGCGATGDEDSCGEDDSCSLMENWNNVGNLAKRERIAAGTIAAGS